MSRTAKKAVLNAPTCMTCHKVPQAAAVRNDPDSWKGWIYQPKFDGVRAMFSTSTRMFTSRQKSQLSVIGSRIIELTRLITPKKYPSIILDGEFYIHGRSFEDILSIVKRADHPEKGALQYIVFDCIVPNHPSMTFEERSEILRDILPPLACINVFPSLCFPIKKSIHTHAEAMVEAGYEGVILRNLSSPYFGGHSCGLLKYKIFDDDEFQIVSAQEGEGKNRNTLVFEMLTKNKKERFTATSPGLYEKKREDFKTWMRYLKQREPENEDTLVMPWTWAKVKYQGVSASGVPRFPVILALLKDKSVL
jgi:ATP-dependent DNA ligase